MTASGAGQPHRRPGILGPWPPLTAAYPAGDHDRLLKSVLLVDDKTALELAWQWLETNDIDDVSFREHRLLIALLARFGKALEAHPYYPRIAGLQRMLWTRALMHLREVRPALASIAESGIEILLIKGAARLADGGTGKSGRVAHDLDIVVRPEDAPGVFSILNAHGWTASSGWSNPRIAHQISALRALNMYKGRFGDIDLHLYPFHPHQGGADDDRRLWAGSLNAELDGIAVRLPAPEQRIALSIGHGGLDSHAHSDWLCDIAAIMRAGPVDFGDLEEIIVARGIEPSAAMALRYLNDECGVPVDAGMLDRITGCAAAKPLRYYASFLQTRPRDRESAAGAVMRGIAKYIRLRASRKALPAKPDAAPIHVRRLFRFDSIAGDNQRTVSETADLSGLNGRLTLNARIRVQPGSRRALDFELRADDEFIGHGSWRSWPGLPAVLTIECSFDKPPEAGRLTFEARPRRADRLIATDADKRRYGAVPFQVLDWSIETTSVG